ncbi:MAG: DNA repair protein [Spirochaetales bacterium]|nr:DNA repair protein [Spirochaetales bacterium]MCF7937303.1 DNA repair protein [Spirochaetales bacterium]
MPEQAPYNEFAPEKIYRTLYSYYGPQGWWPLVSYRKRQGFNERGYHPEIYWEPGSASSSFEVALGAVLTQNTSWKNVEAVLARLHELDLIDPANILSLQTDDLALLIRPSGYFNQKARKLHILAEFFLSKLDDGKRIPAREELLALWGIGPETADSILLYGFHVPVFVVDTYTNRLVDRLYAKDETSRDSLRYHGLQELFQKNLPESEVIFNEFHALIVHLAKDYCRSKPLCPGCPLQPGCLTGSHR